ncbi:MAG: PAS domain S-box protein, partial [Planctomycetota bacterium]
NLVVNKAYTETFGVAASDIVGKYDEDVLPERLAEQCRGSDERAMEEGRTIRVEEEFELDGEKRWLETVKAPVVDDNGETQGLVGLSRDVTDKKKNEYARQQAEERYRKLAEHSIQGMVVFKGVPPRVVYANPGFGDILGYAPEELKGFSGSDVKNLLHPEDREWVFDRYRRRMAGEDLDPRLEFRLIATDGSERWVRLHAARIECGGEPAILATYVDITQQKKRREELESRCVTLEKALEVSDIGVAKVNHNLLVEEANEVMRAGVPDVDWTGQPTCCDVLEGKLGMECPDCLVKETFSDGVSHELTEYGSGSDNPSFIRLITVPEPNSGDDLKKVIVVAEELTIRK